MRNRKAVVIAVLAVLMVFSLAGCNGTAPTDVKSGTIRDTLANVEQMYSGNWRVWFTNDTAAGYCTTDNELGERALNLLLNHDGEVVMEYREIKSDDSEWNTWSNSSCGSIYKGDTSMEIFYIVSITPVAARLRVSPGE